MGARPAVTRVVATKDDDGRRIDQVLGGRVPELSRQKARVLLEIGGVFVDGARVKVASRRVRAGQVIEAHLGPALTRATAATGQAARARDAEQLPAYRVVHEDDDLVIVDKPPGLITAPTPESDRGNLADLLARRPGGARVLVVHRLDRPTSGLLVFAKTDLANHALAARFREHDVERAYLAAVRGTFPDDRTTLELPLAGRRAVTHFAVERRFGTDATLLRCRLETGRTHQIRLHCRHLGHPILGDPQYGEPGPHEPPRMALHATTLGIVHPRTGKTLCFESPWPADLDAWLEALTTQ